MQVCRLALLIEEVSIHARLVNAVELSLIAIEICLAQRPRLRKFQLLQLVSYLS